MRRMNTIALICSVAVLTCGCTTAPNLGTHEGERPGAERPGAGSGDADRLSDASQLSDAGHLRIVECTLPGQLRSLGSSRSFLTPTRPVRVSVSECEIRGGEYDVNEREKFADSDEDEQLYGGMF